MALETTASLRLTKLRVGQTVELRDFQRNKSFAVGTLTGWTLNGEPTEAPKTLKTAPVGLAINFKASNFDGEDIGIVSAEVVDGKPGALFRRVTKGEGDAQKEVLSRLTAYADVGEIAALKEEKAAAIEAAKKAKIAAEIAAFDANNAKKAKSKKAKATVETSAPEVEEITG